MNYDYILIGAGPTNLILALFFSIYKKKCLIIEKENEIGGCHRVIREDGYLTEHGPRVYVSSFVNFINVLKLMDLDFNKLFVKYDHTLFDINKMILKILSIREIMVLVVSFLIFVINPDFWREMSIRDYLEKNDFNDKFIDFINRLCVFTEGGDINKYTVFKLFQLINQQFFYNIYQPRIANDLGLFKLWYEKLDKNYIHFMMNTNVTKLNYSNNSDNIIINVETINKKNEVNLYQANKYILGIPPKNITKVLQNSNINNAFLPMNKLIDWTDKNSYIEYASITFHWNDKINLPKLWGFPKTKWALGFIILSNYFDTTYEASKTIISAAVCLFDTKGNNGKTANECNKQELLDEAYVQLLEYFPELKNIKPDRIILSPKVFKYNDKWMCEDTAFINSNDNKFLKSTTDNYNNFYTVGTHNGNSLYHFTTIESATQNAINFIHSEIPESKKIIKIQQIYTLSDVVIVILIMLIIHLSLK